MSNSEKPLKIDIKLNKPMTGAKLTLINGSFEKIATTSSDSLAAEVLVGLYQVRIDAPGYYQEEYIKVTSDNSFIIEVKSISAFPVYPYKSTHEHHQRIAHQCSKQCTLDSGAGGRPDFLFFLAFYDPAIKKGALPFRDFKLYNDEMTHRLKDQNTFVDEEKGVAVFSAKLPVGLYFISYGPVNEKERIIPVYIFQRKQTQFFIRCTTVPDFSNCRIFYSDRMEFDYNDTVYTTMERLLMAYSNYSYYKLLTEEDIVRIANSTYLVALTHILHIALKKEIPFEQQRQLDLPDLQYLRSESGNKAMVAALSETPPILAFVMYKYSSNNEGSITAASLMDRIAEHLKYDLFWSSFTKIESRNSIIKNIHKGISGSSTIGRALYYLENLNPFASKLNIDDIRKQVEDYTVGHGDEQKIAKKLNIPLTSVIRKYNEYKKVYDSVVNKEKDIEGDDFFSPKH